MNIERDAQAAIDAAHGHPSGPAARLRDVIPVLALLADWPHVTDALVRAKKAGVPDAEVQGLVAGLHGLAHHHEGLARQNGTGPQPAFLPSPAIWTAPVSGPLPAHAEDPDGM